MGQIEVQLGQLGVQLGQLQVHLGQFDVQLEQLEAELWQVEVQHGQLEVHVGQPLLARCLLYKSCLFKLNKQFEYRTTYLKVEGVTYVEIAALLHDLQHCSA